jgi:Cys-rich protein (TIGR01571 family)
MDPAIEPTLTDCPICQTKVDNLTVRTHIELCLKRTGPNDSVNARTSLENSQLQMLFQQQQNQFALFQQQTLMLQQQQILSAKPVAPYVAPVSPTQPIIVNNNNNISNNNNNNNNNTLSLGCGVRRKGPWKIHQYDCCTDRTTFVCSLFCPCIVIGATQDILQDVNVPESPCGYFSCPCFGECVCACLYCLIPCCYHWWRGEKRTYIRLKYAILGDSCTDCCFHTNTRV